MILSTLNFLAEGFAFIYLGVSGFNLIVYSKEGSYHFLLCVAIFGCLAMIRFILVSYG